MEDDNKNKYDFLLILLEEGDAMLCLDARHEGVDVPKAHKNVPSLNLVLNLNFRRPMDIQKEGVYVTLSFSGRPHKCIVPFEAVWAIYEPSMKKIQVWEKSLPKDLDLSSMGFPAGNPQPEKAPAQSAGDLPAQNKPTEKKPVGAKKDRSHLRVIK